MKNLLLKLSVAISLIGILILLIISANLKPKEFRINEINTNQINEKIQINGQVISIKNYNPFDIITIQDQTGKIKVLTENKNKDIKKFDNLTIIGKVSEYNQELEIIPNKILG